MKELQMNGNEQTNWYQGTDEETSALINKKQWDSPDAMAKSYLNLEQMNGDQSKIVKLPDFNNPEETSKFYDKLGRPENAQGYEFEQTGDDKDSYGLFRDVAYNNGLTPKQAEGVYNQFNQGVSALSESKTKELEERSNKALSDLKTEWGDAYEQKMDQAKTGFRDMGFDDSKVEAISAQLGVQDTIKLFSRVGKAGSEPSFVGGERSANTQSIDEQIQEIYNNPDYLIKGKNKPLVDKVVSLQEAKLKLQQSKM